ncbi:hypothetical protein AAFF27_10965 [Xylophilus sp. GW821-FHT01B05]
MREQIARYPDAPADLPVGLIVVDVEALDGRHETVSVWPVGRFAPSYTVLVSLDHAPVMPRHMHLPFVDAWDLAFAMVIAAVTEPAIGEIPFVQPLLWKQARAQFFATNSSADPATVVSVNSADWMAVLTHVDGTQAQGLVPEGSLRFRTVGWILAEMASRLITGQRDIDVRLAAASQASTAQSPQGNRTQSLAGPASTAETSPRFTVERASKAIAAVSGHAKRRK